jgi:hypothetical protein
MEHVFAGYVGVPLPQTRGRADQGNGVIRSTPSRRALASSSEVCTTAHDDAEGPDSAVTA